jgi:hypothetical protein
MPKNDALNSLAKSLAEAAKNAGVPVEITVRVGHSARPTAFAHALSADDLKDFGRDEALQIVRAAIRDITSQDVSEIATDTALNKVNIDTNDMVRRLQRRTLRLTADSLLPEVLHSDKFMDEQLYGSTDSIETAAGDVRNGVVMSRFEDIRRSRT